MTGPLSAVSPINDRSEVGVARRAAAGLGETLGFDEIQTGKVALCVTEAATNIVKHAGRGRILLRTLERGRRRGIEMLALDKGPGIANLAASLRDGTSTAGSPGTGLGALSRLSEAFDIYAPPGHGTALRLEVWARSDGDDTEPIEVGAVCTAKSGETVSGDAWGIEAAGSYQSVILADGLGHGPDAHRAAVAATRVLGNRGADDPIAIVEACHRALVPTRGAALAVARLACNKSQGSFAGVGNIACRVEAGAQRRTLASHNGTVGHTMRRAQQFDFSFPSQALLILHSDGLATHWNLGEYPGLASRHPGVIAGVLYRDHERGRDDATIIVIRNRAGGPIAQP